MKTDIEQLIVKHSKDLTRLCLSLCKNEHDADDLFQDTWCKAIRHYDQYNPAMPFDKWLFSICVNTRKNTLKIGFNSRRQIFSSDDEKTRYLNSIPDKSHDNDDYIALHSAISRLPKKQRIVIALYYFKDYSIKEVADILGIPEGTVKSRLSAAKNTLKRRLTI